MGGERFIPAVKLENGYKPQQSVCVPGPREANCLFVLCVYGLSAAQLTGNLNLKEAAHQLPSSAFCAHTPDKGRHGAALTPSPWSCSGGHQGCRGRREGEKGSPTTELTSLLSPVPRGGDRCWVHQKKDNGILPAVLPPEERRLF